MDARARALSSLTRKGKPVPVRDRRLADRSESAVIVSPTGMAHLAEAPGSLVPACVHYEEGMTEGWTHAPYDWAHAPEGVERCQSCLAL